MNPEPVIEAAAKHSWEALLATFLAVAVVGLLVWLMKSWSEQAHQREERMAKRIDELENFVRTTLLVALQDNSKALIALTTTLNTRACLLDGAGQDRVLAHFVEKLKEV